jgi:hypothetical protein
MFCKECLNDLLDDPDDDDMGSGRSMLEDLDGEKRTRKTKKKKRKNVLLEVTKRKQIKRIKQRKKIEKKEKRKIKEKKRKGKKERLQIKNRKIINMTKMKKKKAKRTHDSKSIWSIKWIQQWRLRKCYVFCFCNVGFLKDVTIKKRCGMELKFIEIGYILKENYQKVIWKKLQCCVSLMRLLTLISLKAKGVKS